MTSRGIITSHLREHKNRAHDIASRDRTADFFRLQALSLNSTLSTGNIRRLELLKTRTYFSLTSQKKSKSYLPFGHQLWYYLLPCCAVFLESFNPSIWNFWKQWVFRSQQAQATCHCFVSLDFLHIKLPWLQFKKDSLSCYANKIGELTFFPVCRVNILRRLGSNCIGTMRSREQSLFYFVLLYLYLLLVSSCYIKYIFIINTKWSCAKSFFRILAGFDLERELGAHGLAVHGMVGELPLLCRYFLPSRQLPCETEVPFSFCLVRDERELLTIMALDRLVSRSLVFDRLSYSKPT